MSHRGALLLLDRGRIRISTDSISFHPDFDYGVNEHFLKVFILTYVRFLSDSPLRKSMGDKPTRTYIGFLKRLTNVPLVDTIKIYSGYADEIMRSSTVTGSDEYFNDQNGSKSTFCDTMRDTPIFMEYVHWYRTRDPRLLKYILSFLRFGKKLDYVDNSLDAIAFHDWQKVEARLHTLSFSDDDVLSLTNIIARLLPRLDTSLLFPKFGTGKVAERDIKDVNGKLAKLAIHPRLAYAFLRQSSFRLSEGLPSLMREIENVDSDHETSRLKFVPKDITKSRSICMEPNSFMYFQQEVLRWMVEAISRGEISRFVNLRDQTVNQVGARHGSKYLSLDTIDLSSASDSVHWNLVKRIFPRDWLFFQTATRTSSVLTSGGTVKVNKFAPMGSAVCFPTQCIVFTAACLYASWMHHTGCTSGVMSDEDVLQTLQSVTTRLTPYTPFGKRYEGPFVYGDDIICDSRITDLVIRLLSRLGFEVNTGKSFTKSQSFRESCGVYCYEGSDVTPVLFRIPFIKKGKWDAKVYASVIGSINQWRSDGYHTISTLWLSILKDYGYSNPLPFVTDADAFGIYTMNKHRPMPKSLRWNADWQIHEEKVQGIGPRTPKSSTPSSMEAYRLDQWWRSRIRGGPTSLEKGEALRIRPQETRLVPLWARYE